MCVMSQNYRVLIALVATSIVLVYPSAGAAPPMSGWSTPVNLGDVVNSQWDENLPALSKDGLTVLHFEPPGGVRRVRHLGLAACRRTAAWGPPFNVGPAINSPSLDTVRRSLVMD